MRFPIHLIVDRIHWIPTPSMTTTQDTGQSVGRSSHRHVCVLLHAVRIIQKFLKNQNVCTFFASWVFEPRRIRIYCTYLLQYKFKLFLFHFVGLLVFVQFGETASTNNPLCTHSNEYAITGSSSTQLQSRH